MLPETGEVPTPVGFSGSGQRVKLERFVCRQLQKGMTRFLPFGEVPCGHSIPVFLQTLLADGNKPARRLIWRVQQHSIDNAEDSSGGADPERQRQNGNRCESWTWPKLSQPIAQILEDILDIVDAAHVATLLFNLVHAAQRAQSCVMGFFRLDALRDQLLLTHGKMETQFVFKVVVKLAAFEELFKCNQRLLIFSMAHSVGRFHNARDPRHHPVPLRRFGFEVPAAPPRSGGNTLPADCFQTRPIPRPAISQFKTMEGRVQRSSSTRRTSSTAHVSTRRWRSRALGPRARIFRISMPRVP